MSVAARIALKVDCDTFEGTKAGLPTLLRIFARAGIRASFYFTLGPDRSGRAIRRVFTQKGFLTKMLRSNAPSLYGPKTMLYGTLLPAPIIGKKLKAEMRAVAHSGHEIGVHGWDHVRWHDRLDKMSEIAIERDYRRAHDMFEEIFGRRALTSAAPGWHATPGSLRVQQRFYLSHTSDTRKGTPFFPKVDGVACRFIEIPTTLPTWDEMLADPQYHHPDSLVDYYAGAVLRDEVHTLHTEVEGGIYSASFEKLLKRWKSNGCTFHTLEQKAHELTSSRAILPAYELRRVTLPHRGGFVTSYDHTSSAVA